MTPIPGPFAKGNGEGGGGGNSSLFNNKPSAGYGGGDAGSVQGKYLGMKRVGSMYLVAGRPMIARSIPFERIREFAE